MDSQSIGISLRSFRRKSILDSFLIEHMADKPITITKLGSEPPAVKPAVAGKRKVTQRTFPRGILKAVSDPAKAPPMKKGTHKHTIRLITEKGFKQRRKTLKRAIKKMTPEKIKKMVQEAGLLKNPDAPLPLMKDMLIGGVMAGIVSL
jgi:hypothetical protein